MQPLMQLDVVSSLYMRIHKIHGAEHPLTSLHDYETMSTKIVERQTFYLASLKVLLGNSGEYNAKYLKPFPS